MNNNDDLIKNYLDFQKRQKEIIEESKKRRLENKNNAEQAKNLSVNTKDQLKNYPDQALLMNEIRTANLSLAEIEFKKGNFKGAIPFFTKAIKIDPNVADYYLRRGLAKVNFIDQQEHLDYLVNELINTKYEYVPDLPKSLKKDLENYQGTFSDKNVNYQSAMDDYNKALDINPKFGNAFFYRGCLQKELEKYQDAIDDYNKALEVNPKFGNAFFHRACSKMYLNDFDGAITDYTKAIENPKDEYRAKNQFIYVDRAEAKFKLKNYQGAMDDCNKAIAMEPEYGGAFNLRGKIKFKLDDYQGALDDYTNAIKINPEEFDDFYFCRATVKEKLGDYQGAIDDCTKALMIDPNNHSFSFFRGILEEKLENYQSAIYDFTKAIKIDRNCAQYYCRRGYAKEKLGDYQSAIEDYDKALAIDPNNHSFSFFREDAKRKNKRLEKNKQQSKNLLNQNKELLNIQKVKGKYLGVVNDKLSKKYSEDEIAIACGYFEIKNQVKVPLVKEYREESLKSKAELRQLKSNYSTDDYYLKYIELDIFKGLLCEHDEDHGGILYVPKKIIENSKDWDYQKADLENFDIEYVDYEDGLEDFESNISEKYTEDQIKELDMEKEFLEFYGFSEPMMFIHVSLMHYVDHNLKTNYKEYFEREDIAEAYGIRYKDIHEKSFFA